MELDDIQFFQGNFVPFFSSMQWLFVVEHRASVSPFSAKSCKRNFNICILPHIVRICESKHTDKWKKAESSYKCNANAHYSNPLSQASKQTDFFFSCIFGWAVSAGISFTIRKASAWQPRCFLKMRSFFLSEYTEIH